MGWGLGITNLQSLGITNPQWGWGLLILGDWGLLIPNPQPPKPEPYTALAEPGGLIAPLHPPPPTLQGYLAHKKQPTPLGPP